MAISYNLEFWLYDDNKQNKRMIGSHQLVLGECDGVNYGTGAIIVPNIINEPSPTDLYNTWISNVPELQIMGAVEYVFGVSDDYLDNYNYSNFKNFFRNIKILTTQDSDSYLVVINKNNNRVFNWIGGAGAILNSIEEFEQSPVVRPGAYTIITPLFFAALNDLYGIRRGRGVLCGYNSLETLEDGTIYPSQISLITFNGVTSTDNRIYLSAIQSTSDSATLSFFSLPTILKDENPTDDPFYNGGETNPDEPIGGGGNFDNTSDNITDPWENGIPEELELHSAINTGLCTLYNPTSSQLNSVSKFLWSDTWSIDSFKKIFNNPIETILGLLVVPVQPDTSDSKNIMFGNLDSNITAPVISKEFKLFDFGSVELGEYWGCYLDYNPYTKINLYLPYIGYTELNADDYINNTISVRYAIDLLTGALLAQIKSGTQILSQVQGQCASLIPITAADHRNEITNAISTTLTGLGLIGVSAVGGIATEAMAAASIASYTATTAKNIMGSKTVYSKGGGMTGSAGHLSVRVPYIQITRPRQSLAAGYNAFEGYPSNKTMMLQNASGFTSVEACNLHIDTATEEELVEVMNLLRKGVIL